MPGCSLTNICAETGFSRPSVIEAIRFLSNELQRFIEEAGLESDGTKRYRVTAFAWFGQKPKTPDLPLDTGSKNSLPPSPSKKFLPPHVHDDVPIKKHDSLKETSSIHVRAAIEKIFETVFDGINVQRLAKRVDSTELAQEWADWCLAPETRKQFNNPQGIAYRRLTETKNARPMPVNQNAQHVHPAKPEPQNNLRAQQQQCGTHAHTLYARHNGGCVHCGIPAQKTEPESASN